MTRYCPKAMRRVAAAIEAGHQATVDPKILTFALRLGATLLDGDEAPGAPTGPSEPAPAGAWLVHGARFLREPEGFCLDAGGCAACPSCATVRTHGGRCEDHGTPLGLVPANAHPAVAVGTRCDSGPAWDLLFDVDDEDYSVPPVMVDRFNPCQLCGHHMDPGCATYS